MQGFTAPWPAVTSLLSTLQIKLVASVMTWTSLDEISLASICAVVMGSFSVCSAQGYGPEFLECVRVRA